MSRILGKGSRRSPSRASARRRSVAEWMSRATHAVATMEELGADIASIEAFSSERPETFIYRFDQWAAAGRWVYAAELVAARRYSTVFRLHVRAPHQAAARDALVECGARAW